jgi:hypothetical protein
MYFKIINVISVGDFTSQNVSVKYITYLNAALAFICLVMGLLPQIQLFILDKVLL